MGVLDKRIAFLEKQDKMRGYQAQHDSMLKSKAAMEKGVVGSGQMSAKEFAASRAGEASGGMSTDKAAAAAGIAQQMGILPGGGQEGQTMDESQGAQGGAISGAMMGAQLSGGNPIGAVVGGVAGAVQGAAAARAAAKAHNREVEAKKHQALAEIEMKKGEQMSNAIQGMAGRMRIT